MENPAILVCQRVNDYRIRPSFGGVIFWGEMEKIDAFDRRMGGADRGCPVILEISEKFR
jgi:hypothetical protein